MSSNIETIPYDHAADSLSLDDAMRTLIELKEHNAKEPLSYILPAKNESRIVDILETILLFMLWPLVNKNAHAADGLIKEIVLVDASSSRDGEQYVDTARAAVMCFYDTIMRLHITVDEIKKIFGCMPLKIHLLREDVSMTEELFASMPHYSITNAISGKGAGMYHGVALTSSSYIAFSDCDTENFDVPFLYRFLKAYFSAANDHTFIITHYEKGTYQNEQLGVGEAGNSFGGRVNRLVFQPFFRALASSGYYRFGMQCPRYALSGEFIIPRSVLETLHFPTKYEIETLINLFILDHNFSIRDVHLGSRRHIPQTDDKIDAMAAQIFNAFIYYLKTYCDDGALFLASHGPAIENAYAARGIECSLDKHDTARIKRYCRILRTCLANNGASSIFLPPLKAIADSTFRRFYQRKAENFVEQHFPQYGAL